MSRRKLPHPKGMRAQFDDLLAHHARAQEHLNAGTRIVHDVIRFALMAGRQPGSTQDIANAARLPLRTTKRHIATLEAARYIKITHQWHRVVIDGVSHKRRTTSLYALGLANEITLGRLRAKCQNGTAKKVSKKEERGIDAVQMTAAAVEASQERANRAWRERKQPQETDHGHQPTEHPRTAAVAARPAARDRAHRPALGRAARVRPVLDHVERTTTEKRAGASPQPGLDAVPAL